MAALLRDIGSVDAFYAVTTDRPYACSVMEDGVSQAAPKDERPSRQVR